MTMSSSRKKFLEDLKLSDMSAEFQCLNILQKTAWKINRSVYGVMREVWEKRLKIGKLPDQSARGMENYPFEKNPQEFAKDSPEWKEYKQWASKRAQVYDYNATQNGRKIQVSETLEMASEYLEFDRFYFIWQNDFRTRKYPLSVFLQPQAAEWGKSLLMFANGVEIKNPEDARWLAIHGANVFGNDKLSLNDRINWAYGYSDSALLVASSPTEHYELWSDADKPFLFLAWCFEWAAYTKALEQGETFFTHLPCAADGTSNGIQHLSAILRDERGGRSVNLTPSIGPQDIYGEVALDTKQKLADFIAACEEKEIYQLSDKELRELDYAKKWLEFGISRKMTKRPTMIIPYAGTQQACRVYVEEAYKEYLEDGVAPAFDNADVMRAVIFLTKQIWDAIGTVIQASKSVMQFIQKIAGLYGSVGVPMEWTTPTGALVRPLYFDKKEQNISTVIQGHVHRYKVISNIEDKLDTRKMRTASAPNLIHSMDASALTLTVITANEVDGITDFAMVHDSFATHSPNMPILSSVLRECFVEIYLTHDIMQELRDHAIEMLCPLGIPEEEIPIPPTKGTLDINKVLDSEYFFS